MTSGHKLKPLNREILAFVTTLKNDIVEK